VQVSGVHDEDGAPHTPATPPPPQVWPGGQTLQLVVRPPQPSACWPQVPMGWVAQVCGVQLPPSTPPHWPATPAPPHV
jgi:hypothetical protein